MSAMEAATISEIQISYEAMIYKYEISIKISLNKLLQY